MFLPIKTYFREMAAEIIKQTGKPCDYFCMTYNFETKELSYIVDHYNDGNQTKYSYESSVISGMINLHVLTKLNKGTKPKFALVFWHRTEDDKCYYDLRFEENGKPETLKEKY